MVSSPHTHTVSNGNGSEQNEGIKICNGLFSECEKKCKEERVGECECEVERFKEWMSEKLW